MTPERPYRYGVVAIGRNEGERLKQCLTSAQSSDLIVYVDSGSTDDSVVWAKDRGVEVVDLDMKTGFTAARARNSGFARLMELRPDLQYVQFIDGDCELAEQWPERSIAFLHTHQKVCAVFGRRRERHPDHSLYNELCDREWNVPIGEARFFGGDVMMRTAALTRAGGYRDELIAGEEPEFSVRLRAAGWLIWRIDEEMTLHDAAIARFEQWWRRHVRSGYAFANGAHLHGSPPERLWVWESRRAILWGLMIPLIWIVLVVAFGLPGLLAFLIYPLQLGRRILRIPGTWRVRVQLAFFELLSRFPESIGQLKFYRDNLLQSRPRIIEYK
ncbi:glycosyl transferase [Bradyrhizobium lablabi]|uniref:Glycosyl transferase n=1 Tax=Bradyrhizobium lablabi TaxID=722472 RepID=A0A0R3N6V5_9BRAD|nr:glycosyltransferase family 2 protein [Bradyrhizobium lablabi]KRR27886.1 glycosyl transferase [Bradyrhizobium lablabi]